MAGVEHGVGLTALMVAAGRAIETHRPDSLARDEYAERFVRAAHASASWPTRIDDAPDGDSNPLWGRLCRYFGLRTRVFDDFLLESTRAGNRQVVLLGAGLDSRALRLDWPPDCVVHEIDRAEVLAFKDTVLGEAPPSRRSIPTDLRGDWAQALLAGGFSPAAPTTWLAEGILLYLPAAAERHLISTVDSLSAPGSDLAYEIKLDLGSPANPLYTSTRDQTGIDLPALFNPDPRPDSTTTLHTHGWSTTTHTPFHFTHHHGRGPHPEPNDALSGNRWVFAHKPS
ncbi:SAM-dependent methyltransferase [Actinokineospora globicatena]|uniref:S-adenosyl-L-methionine-dependent methyltransferase n=1 Tax=Actinokineospora globicatena TaxID=103729 RepID=A0A9W6QL88_9PSEU|nr:SAM-dependent methyltransferase [Actinokineospora globicatena]GLW90298.1 putative S-adenosyl-L-methionine-dependent methyltransferase [Actinokineospora globicatena]